jgi:hypothetical protein
LGSAYIRAHHLKSYVHDTAMTLVKESQESSMKGIFWTAAVSAVLIVLNISSASASDAVIMIKAAGEAYEGAPRLGLLADGQLVGERALDRSIDTASGQKLTNANWREHVEWLKFDVSAIEAVAKLEIEFKNVAWAGEGKTGGRSIVVYGLFIDGYRFGPKTMNAVPAKSGGAWADKAMLWSEGRLQLGRPTKGWRGGYKAATPN